MLCTQNADTEEEAVQIQRPDNGTVTYNFFVRNNFVDFALSNVTITDPSLSDTPVHTWASLGPSEEATFWLDVPFKLGMIRNDATVTAKIAGTENVIQVSNAAYYVGSEPGDTLPP
jgi:hypothetical protein